MLKAGVLRRHVKNLIAASVIVFGFGTFISKADAADYNPYIAVQDFTWKEFVDGQRVVKESGTLFGIGFIFRKEFEDRIVLEPSAEIFGGDVDYNGQACDSTGFCEPATSTVTYFGLKAQVEVGRSISVSSTSFIEPFAGIGLRAWTRDIGNGTTASGGATQGYTEDWLAFDGLVGLRAGRSVSSRNQIFAEAGVKLPIYNENTAYVSDIGQGPDITLHPGKQAAFFAEVGMKISHIKASVFYDSLRFPQSATVSNGFIEAYQPKSTMDIYGLRIGVTF